MPKFMLILHQTPGAYDKLSPEEMQQTFQRYQSWVDGIKTSGRYVVSDKLKEEGGKLVTRNSGQVTVTDGPFSEAKEVVGGYFTLRAADYNEAVALVKECPFLECGTISIRQTDPMGCGDE